MLAAEDLKVPISENYVDGLKKIDTASHSLVYKRSYSGVEMG